MLAQGNTNSPELIQGDLLDFAADSGLREICRLAGVRLEEVAYVLLMGELFGDTLRKKDASRHGKRPFSVMCHQKARPFTDLRGVPSSDAP